MKSLAIIGAGPKAVAVHAKLRAMQHEGLEVPDVTVFDPQGVGGNWRACGGWTDGRQQLGTSPDKDMGFPYRTRIVGGHNAAVDRQLLTVGWVQFLTETDRYASWIDRGHPNPPHHLWASYLQWVAYQTAMNVVPARITSVEAGNSGGSDGAAGADRSNRGGWTLHGELIDGTPTTTHADSVLVTGPGPSNRKISDLPGVLSLAEFWQRISQKTLPAASRVVVIGSGESAASVLDQLIRRDIVSAICVSPLATMYSRGESQFENELYTDPRKWALLSDEARRDFIHRTDRGVLSVKVQQALHADDRVEHRKGIVSRVELDQSSFGPDVLRVHISDEVQGDYSETCDVVIDARGGCPLWFTDLFSDQTMADLKEAVGGELTAAAVEQSIAPDMSVEGLGSILFVPSLAGMKHGPGFANLSCLGELSDRIIAGLGVGELAVDHARQDAQQSEEARR